MKKVIRLSENDLARIVRRVIYEQNEQPIGMPNPSAAATVNQPKGGPLTGTLVVRNNPANVEFGDMIEFNFRAIKNAGKAPITINKIVPMNDNMFIETKTPFTVQPGQTFQVVAKQKLVKGGTSTERMDANGVVEYDQTIRVMTNGAKKDYTLYCRQRLFFFDGNR